MEQAARRKIFTSGADQVNKRPAAKLNITVSHADPANLAIEMTDQHSKVVVVWPAPGRGFKDVHNSDTDVMAMVSRIAKDHESMIEVEEVDGAVTVTVQAINRAKAREIIALLRVQLLHRSAEELWRARLLVNPSSHGGDLRAILLKKDGTIGRYIAAAKTSNPEGIDAAAFAAKMANYKSDLATTLDKTTQMLRHDPNGMRMKVQFGTLLLHQWKKDKVEYDLAELGALLRSAGTRGTSKMLNT